MIAIKKKGIFIIFFIIFLINIFSIVKRRDFNFSNLMNSFYLSEYHEIKKDLNMRYNENDIKYDYTNIIIFLKINKIKEINIDKDILKKYNNMGDIIFYIYPIKFNDKSQYVISYFNKSKYNGCKLIISKPKNEDEKNLNKRLTLYICE
jgi:predicted RND superfamily exporter protein